MPAVHILISKRHRAQVFADDIFKEVFARDPWDKLAWRRYRREILEYGGSRNELEMVEEFLGRTVNPRASLWNLVAVL